MDIEDIIGILGFIVIAGLQLLAIGFVCMGVIHLIGMIPWMWVRAIALGFGACIVYGFFDNWS